MRLSDICIDRPVLTVVMSLIIVLFGAISFTRLPNRELPDIDPPVVSVTTIYPGAAAEVVETSVTEPLEEAVNGIEGVKHITSTSREQVSQISVEFGLTRDIEDAANDVRDRVARAANKLPEEVNQPIIAKRDADTNAVVWASLSGENYTQIELTSIADNRIKDRFAKLPGVATVIVGGERRYSMRIWLENRKLGAQQLSVAEVVAVLRSENVDIPSGRVEGETTEFTVRSLGELKSVSDYENLVVAVRDGKPVRLSAVAMVEVGPEDSRKIVRFNGNPGIGLGVVKQSKANTLSVAQAVRKEIEEIRSELPEGLELAVAFDSSVFIQESVDDVSDTIFQAALLVVLVIYVFLRSARATLIPAIAIPVSIIGAFAMLDFAGYSINTLTLMGVTLAIGLVVDDAIVVLENITRWIERGTPPMEAARRGMSEIAFAVVAATLSAVAVFLPLVFLTDTTGRLFREFAVTVAAAILISGLVALTLAPMLAARILKPAAEEGRIKSALARAIEVLAASYSRTLTPIIHRPALSAACVGLGALWLAFGFFLYSDTAEELVTNSDRGAVFVITEAPEGSTVEYMEKYQRQAEEVILAVPEIARSFSVIALGLDAPGAVNKGILLTQLEGRNDRERSQHEIIDALRPELKKIAGITTYPLHPNPFRGFSSDPIQIVVQGPDVFELARMADEIKTRAEETGDFEALRSNLVLNKPQIEVSVDRDRASDLGMSMKEIGTTLQILLGGLDITTFKQDGETYNVMAQLRRADRFSPSHVLELFVNGHAGLIPLAAVVSAEETIAPRELHHFDRYRAVTITAGLSGSVGQGEGLERMMAIAQDVVPAQGGYYVRYSGEAENFFETGSALIFAYLLAVLVVYLVLSAQFESFVYPIAILVGVFLSFTGALVALRIPEPDMTLNLFSKIGIVMLVGIVTKNAILIVEFANQLRGRGMELADATAEAARTRFRPILMTALATMAGIFPIAMGWGAGGESRAPLGVAVVGGMGFATVLTFFVVPATYVSLERVRARISGHRPNPVLTAPPASGAGRAPDAAAIGGGS